MTTFILRNTTPVENRRLPKAYHSYVVFNKETREQVAEIKWTYRPKNAGGHAYQARVIEPNRFDGMPVHVWSKDLKKLCEIVRHINLREGEAPSHWR